MKILKPEQREAYLRDGFVCVESLVDEDWLERLRGVTAEFVDESRSLTESNRRFDLEPTHSAAQPRIRRLNSPVDQHEVYWEFARSPVILDLVEDLIGPDIKFHHGKLNFKAPLGGEQVKWHQDIQFWPHTNYDLLTVGVFLVDVKTGMGNVGFIPRSHASELFDQYDGDSWAGCLSDADLARVRIETAVYPTGPAGSVTVHNCRTIHGSSPNDSDQERPLLLQTYAPADAFPYTDIGRGTAHAHELIRGQPARWSRHDPRPCQIGPVRARTIFEVQQRESLRASD